MITNEVFTLIPQKSYEAIVGDRQPTIPLLLTALLVDPDEAADVEVKGDAKIHLDDFVRAGANAVASALQTISQKILVTDDPVNAIGELYDFSPLLALWCFAKGVSLEGKASGFRISVDEPMSFLMSVLRGEIDKNEARRRWIDADYGAKANNLYTRPFYYPVRQSIHYYFNFFRDEIMGEAQAALNTDIHRGALVDSTWFMIEAISSSGESSLVLDRSQREMDRDKNARIVSSFLAEACMLYPWQIVKISVRTDV